MKKAIINGISGQDGSYLTEHLLDLGYEVHGIVRRNSVPEHQESRIHHLDKMVNLHYGDVQDHGNLSQLIEAIEPDEFYNLAAQSHVKISFEVPHYTAETNAIGVLSILEILKSKKLTTKFYQASSSEMFGSSVDSDGYQRETTPMNPVSPYGCAKLFGYHMTRIFRNSYEIFASNGILFNHESPRRGSNFVSSKIIKTACEIKLGIKDKLELGNLDSFRDWGHSKDYVRAMVKILNHSEPDDFVVSTGDTRSIRELVDLVFQKLELNYEDFVVQNPKFYRPQELPYLRGDSSKVRSVLGWKPEISFEEMVEEMVKNMYDKLVMKL
jgi:GDPmannose 4,6-dehydratase